MGLFCGKRCQNRKDRKLELKWQHKDLRLELKTERALGRQETRQVAYQNGIDPNASMWSGLSSIAGSAAGAVTGIWGNPSALSAMNPQQQVVEKQNMFIWIIVAVVALVVLKK